MPFITDFIYLDYYETDKVNYSYSEILQDEEYIYFKFALSNEECFVENSDKFYLINIRISQNYITKYSEPFEIIIEKQKICCNTKIRLLEIINCNLSGIQKKIYIESKILYLLYQSQNNNLLFHSDCDNCEVLKKTITLEKIIFAKKYILNHLSDKLTIPKIAGKVGTNECYLKKGFKELFGQTIFEFIQENRMQKAKLCLANTNRTILEVSIDVGYSSLSSFSQAYKNYYGVPPSRDQKQKITIY